MAWSSWNFFATEIERVHRDRHRRGAGVDRAGRAGLPVCERGRRLAAAHPGPPRKMQADPTKFPGGMRHLSDRLHALGLKKKRKSSDSTLILRPQLWLWPGLQGPLHHRVDFCGFWNGSLSSAIPGVRALVLRALSWIHSNGTYSNGTTPTTPDIHGATMTVAGALEWCG